MLLLTCAASNNFIELEKEYAKLHPVYIRCAKKVDMPDFVNVSLERKREQERQKDREREEGVGDGRRSEKVTWN